MYGRIITDSATDRAQTRKPTVQTPGKIPFKGKKGLEEPAPIIQSIFRPYAIRLSLWN